jgi:hypothetical protein
MWIAGSDNGRCQAARNGNGRRHLKAREAGHRSGDLPMLVWLAALLICPVAGAGILDDPYEVFPSPVMFGPNAEVRVYASGLHIREFYELWLQPEAVGLPAVQIEGSFEGTIEGYYDEVLPVPDAGQLPAGLYELQLRRAMTTPPQIYASAQVEVLPELVVIVDPAAGPAGSIVSVEVSGLRPGHLTIDYAGVPVLGPVPVSGPDFQGEFHVPFDRPSNFTQTSVIARNTSRRTTMLTGSASFQPAAPRSADPVRLISINGLPGRPLATGDSFRLTGQIGVRVGNPDRLLLEPVMQMSSGVTVPLLPQPVTLDANGFFDFTAVSPNLALNHGVLAESGQIKFVVRKPGRALPSASGGPDPYTGMDGIILPGQHSEQGISIGSVDIGQINFLPIVNDLRIQVQLTRPAEAGESGPQPLANARIVVNSRADLVKPSSFETSSRFFSDQLLVQHVDISHAFPSQVKGLEANVYQASDYAYDPLTGCGAELFRGYTDDNGEFEIVLNKETLELKTAFTTTGGFNPLDPEDVVKPLALPLDFEIMINALPEGYGECSGSKCSASVVTAIYSFQFDEFRVLNPATGKYVGVGKDWLLEKTLPALPEGADIGLVAEARFLALSLIPGETNFSPIFGGSSYDKRYKPITSLVHVHPSQIDQIQPLRMRFSHNANLYGQLESAELWRNGSFFHSINLSQALNGSQCVEGDDEVHYLFNVLLAHSLSVGSHDFEVRFVVAGGAGLEGRSQRLRLQMESPPAWFGAGSSLPSALAERRVTLWSPAEVKLFGREKAPPQREQDGEFSSTEYDFEIPGDVENRSNLSGREIRESRAATGDASYSTEQVSSNRGASRDAAPKKQAATLAKGSQVTIGDPNFQTIIDTGRIPLFRMSWGYWPLAGALIGADAWFAAMYRYYGLSSMLIEQDQAKLLVEFDTALQLNAGVALFMDISILFNLIRVRGEALGQVALGLETGFSNRTGQMQVATPESCIRLAIIFAVQATAGWCPFCVEANESVPVLDQTWPESATGLAACFIPAIDAQVLASARSSGSFNDSQPVSIEGSNGHGMKVWVKDGVLHYRKIANGANNGPSAPLFNLCGSGLICNSATSPKLGILKNNRYVLAWSESGFRIPEGSNSWSIASDFRIFYRVWNGTSWSVKQQLSGTGNTLGEGSLHLASCPNYESGCPEHGEVAAVWSRELEFHFSKDILGKSDVYFSRFRSVGSPHSWDSAIKINGNMAWQNNMARTVYTSSANRPPLVVWVNSASALVRDTDDRRIYYRYPLVGGSTPQLAMGTNPGVGWLDATTGSGNHVHFAYTVGEDEVAGFMGNQQEIYAARASCTPTTGCNFNERRVLDQFGRSVRGENVRVAAGSGGKTEVYLRGLGYGKNAQGFDYFKSDSMGMVQSTGQVIKLTQGYGVQNIGHIAELTNDGALYWNLDMTQSSNGDVLLSAVSLAQLSPELTARMRQAGYRDTQARMETEEFDDGVIFGQLLAAPDFAIDAILPEETVVEPGGTFEIRVMISNSGTDYIGSGALDAIELVASWNGPSGIGTEGAVVVLTELLSGSSEAVPMVLNVPEELLAEGRHAITVTINPHAAILEQTMVNNADTIHVGGLEPPQNIRLGGGAGHRHLFLNWDEPNDPNASSVRVYRQDGDGPIVAIGSSPVGGFLDLTSQFGQPYNYYLSTISVNGVESGLTGPLPATIIKPSVIFRDRFQMQP